MHPVTLQNKTIIKVLVLLAIIFSNTDGLASVDALIKKHQIPENKLSIILEDSESGERLISINPSTTRSPGSVTKIFTAFAALDLLGEAYQWRTDAFIEKENNNKEIVDHLLIRGGGDPSFSLKDLEKLILNIRAKGIREIRDDIYFDQTFFRQRKKSTAKFDKSPLRPYNTMHSSLIINSNKIDLSFNLNEKTSKPDITPLFLPIGIEIENNLSVGTGKCKDFRSQVTFDERFRKETLTILINGVYPAQCKNLDHDLAITRTEHYFFGVFKKLWLNSGGTINGYYKKKNKSNKHVLVAHVFSEELSTALEMMLKESDNLTARNIFLSLPEFSKRKELRNSRKLLYGSMKENNIYWHFRNIIDNGSGLSRVTRIKAESVMSLIQEIDQGTKFSSIKSMLPISGVDGTLKNIYQSKLLRGQLRLKTGTLNGVRCLAGFITTKSGNEYRFVFMHNNYDEYDYDLRSFTTELFNMIVTDSLT
ncbi:MAG: D-alanyl-D-alanine carboxypeptidase/D-alanyl-D-alanine-endopeptidase [Pseudomonadota bacterium]|nr:D-alanyl-D-alanine carboxypeptidase/D-alanyl-D-alanine-endopeptidase [Pseudomonadota bacterium]